MKTNPAMKYLLAEYKLESIDLIPQNSAFPIWKKTDHNGRAYWGVSSFWGLDKHPIGLDQDLSQLEWDGNEVYLDAHTDEEITNILRQAIGIVAFWKHELETRYPEIPFYVFASYDNGNLMIPCEGELPFTSVTLRFWADRGSNTVIDLEHYEEWKQPAILEYCNFAQTSSQIQL